MDRPARSESLYWICYSGTHTHTHTHIYILPTCVWAIQWATIQVPMINTTVRPLLWQSLVCAWRQRPICFVPHFFVYSTSLRFARACPPFSGVSSFYKVRITFSHPVHNVKGQDICPAPVSKPVHYGWPYQQLGWRQHSFRDLLLIILIFKRLTARRLCKSFGVKGLNTYEC
jgi:hypothetical protein